MTAIGLGSAGGVGGGVRFGAVIYIHTDRGASFSHLGWVAI